MPLTKGQALALHTLLTTRSQFRLQLEGKFVVIPGPPPTTVFAENVPPANKAGDAGTLVNNVIAQAGGLHIPASNFDQATKTKLNGLFDPNGKDLNGAQTNVATDQLKIRHALAMDAPYPDNTPCPPFQEQSAMAAAIIGALPGPLN
jgi:hypothetical protein